MNLAAKVNDNLTQLELEAELNQQVDEAFCPFTKECVCAIHPSAAQAEIEKDIRASAVDEAVWDEAIGVASQYGSASVHAYGDPNIPSLLDSLRAAKAKALRKQVT